MASRKEEKERRRAERLAAERRESGSGRLRLIAGYAVAGLIGAAVLVGVIIALASGGDDDGTSSASDAAGAEEQAYWRPDIGSIPDDAVPDNREGAEPPPIEIGDLEASADAAGCELRLDLPDEGSNHFTDEDRDPGWETNPATSGDHYGVPTEVGSGALGDGAFAEPPSMARVVHGLEHGRIAIQYSPDLPEEDQLALKGVFEDDPGGMILFPNPDMPFEVSATAWRNMVGCETYEGSATLDVVRNFRDIYRGRGPEEFPIAPPS